MAKDSIIKVVTGASFLAVLMGLLLFFYSQSFQTSSIFPKDADLWNKIIGGYLLIFTLGLVAGIIFVPQEVRRLATANYWKSFGLKFIPAAVFWVAIFTLFKSFFTSSGLDIFQAISYMPWTVLLVHIFVISQVEEILFGGLIYTSINNKYGYKSAQITTIILFALFHFAKTGGSLIVMATYVPLRYWFNYQRNYGTPVMNRLPVIGQKFFGATPETQQSNAAAHASWNLLITGILNNPYI